MDTTTTLPYCRSPTSGALQMPSPQPTPIRPNLPPTDEFATDDGYSPHDIYNQATDGRGNSAELRVRVPPTVAGEIASLIEQRKIAGYRTSADVVRDALIHRLRFITDELVDDPAMTRRVQAEIASLRMERLRQGIERMDQMVTDARTALRKARESGNRATVSQALSDAGDLADGLESPWKERVEEMMREYRS